MSVASDLFEFWYAGRPVLEPLNSQDFSVWVDNRWALVVALQEPVFAIVHAHVPFVADVVAIARTPDVTAVWWYARRDNTEDAEEQGQFDASKTPTFTSYEVVVYSRATQSAEWVERRRAYPTVEVYQYTAAMNVADAGALLSYLRFAVRVLDGGQVSPFKILDVTLVT